MAAGESPKVAISSPAQYCGLRLRWGTRIQEQVLRRWCKALNQEYRGQRLAGLAHEIFLKLLKAKREVSGAAERQKTLAAQDGKCALCGCGLTGACELDHVVPVRQAFAGSVQTLQALCDCHSEKTLRESAQPTSLESRVAPGVMEYVRSPSCLLWFLRRRRAQRTARTEEAPPTWLRFSSPARLKIQGRSWDVLRSAVCLEVLLPRSFKSLCFGRRRDRLSPRRVWSWAPGDCASSKGRSGCFCCVFSVLIPLSSSYSVLIPVLIPVLIHGFAGRATRNKLSVNRF